ncbi:hypothetical protein TRIP_D300140 [uncultured Paludibacter sp.]|uniref:Mannosyl-glycoprotein endo-beta-N-acetylglucosamidase-like domain-containing protein n=1 Tax=uncultured Paludibacter sp. TaxID=497635 RepID=A0A653AB04_9BACT|nr:hypothetical protein TRIP_D300140 [uncultured Paludibacter sp.]
MTTKEFISKYYIQALRVSAIYNIPVTGILAQAAHESGYGNHAPGYNFFGITAGSNWRGKRQLLKTREFHNSRNIRYPIIISIAWNAAKGGYEYIVRRYFRLYSSALWAFIDYANLISNNSRYQKALDYYLYPEKYLTEIAKAGYATDPNYLTKVLAVHRDIMNALNYLGLNEA